MIIFPNKGEFFPHFLYYSARFFKLVIVMSTNGLKMYLRSPISKQNGSQLLLPRKVNEIGKIYPSFVSSV